MKAARLDAARQLAGAVFAAARYAPVEPPIVAPAEIFLERLGERFRRLTTFFEDGSGEELCLRPELTIPVCRMALTGGYDGANELRLRYAGPVFRLGGEGAGPLSESAQAGAEFFGSHETAKAEAEILALTVAALAACGVKTFRIILGDAGAFADLIAGLSLDARQRAHLRRLFEAHGGQLVAHLPPEGSESGTTLKPLDFDLALADTLSRLDTDGLTLTGGRAPEDVARRLADRAGRASAEAIPAAARAAIAAFFDLAAPLRTAPEALRAFFAQHSIASTAPDRLAALHRDLVVGGIAVDAIAFDASVHAPLGYYTGLEFRIDADDVTVASGGRYDALIRELGGPDVPAVGVGLFLDPIAERTA